MSVVGSNRSPNGVHLSSASRKIKTQPNRIELMRNFGLGYRIDLWSEDAYEQACEIAERFEIGSSNPHPLEAIKHQEIHVHFGFCPKGRAEKEFKRERCEVWLRSAKHVDAFKTCGDVHDLVAERLAIAAENEAEYERIEDAKDRFVQKITDEFVKTGDPFLARASDLGRSDGSWYDRPTIRHGVFSLSNRDHVFEFDRGHLIPLREFAKKNRIKASIRGSSANECSTDSIKLARLYMLSIIKNGGNLPSYTWTIPTECDSNATGIYEFSDLASAQEALDWSADKVEGKLFKIFMHNRWLLIVEKEADRILFELKFGGVK